MSSRRSALQQLARRADGTSAVPECSGWGTDLGNMDLRIASVFIILVGSLLGVSLPMLLARTPSHWRISKVTLFVCKYVGSGVILSTAFMHLLSPAVQNLSDACLSDRLPDYDWGHAICLMTIMVMFAIELLGSRFSFDFGHSHESAPSTARAGAAASPISPPLREPLSPADRKQYSCSSLSAFGLDGVDDRGNCREISESSSTVGSNDIRANATAHIRNGLSLSVDLESAVSESQRSSETEPAKAVELLYPPHIMKSVSHVTDNGQPGNNSTLPGCEEHLAHDGDHTEGNSHNSSSSQIVSLLILEFGIVFHSLFIGLTLAGTDNLKILLIVIAFHQFFEGLGLGSRLAQATWPSNWKTWSGPLMGLGFSLTTPIGIAIGLGVNKGLASNPAVAQLVNGVFDAISSGILVYTALVELMAHEFMFNPEMRDAELAAQLLAYGCVAVGVAIMAILAKWA
ncbi:plasma membrane low affinity zinc ion transporter [Grosmannia clavigera kw1407]|uniref:Plasma membrane low affinity zinc ion transporter n=1 Tax=Grosmannia clavigera (strain kw1407 / UAMH 11150) TaxID=655863 RepID=F0XR27_GROCL|nr:plasma membrane low affinity zinc ion transporter [Grosmannia clavigera kw1407]EFW99932.1 plasma membrane low affinity zinc ion transporter [Grosmannia clavigera kw1407]